MTHKPLSSLQARVVALVLVAVAPVFVLVLVMGLRNRRDDIDRANANALQLAYLAAEHHDRLAGGAQQLLAGLSRLPEVRRLDVAACDSTFAEVLRDNPVYGTIGLTDLYGNIISPPAAAAARLNAADQLWFPQVRGARGFTIGGYQRGRITGQMVLICGQPLRDESGQVTGVIFISLHTDWLERFADAAKLPAGSTLTVLSRDGNVWARHPDGADWVGKAVPEAPVVRDVLGAGLHEAPDLGGEARVMAFAPLSVSSVQSADAPGSPVYVVASLPRHALLAGANHALAAGLSGLGVVTLLTILAAAMGSRLWLYRWVHQLTDATRQLAGGNLSARARLTGGPLEIRQLGECFDDMAAALEQATGRRTAAEADLRDSHGLLRAVVEFVDDALYVKDLDGKYLLLNGGGARGVGWRADDAVGRIDADLFGPDAARAMRALDLRVVQSGHPETFEEQVTIDGAEHVFLTTKAPYRDADGNVIGLFGISRDVTASKRAERAVRQSERHLRNVLDSLFAFVGVLTPEGILVEVNRAALVSAGARPEDVLGKPFDQTYWMSQSPREQARLREAIARAVRGESSRYDMTVVHADGKQIVADFMLAPMFDEDGRVTHLVPSATDVTEQRQADRALRESEERLSLATQAAGLATWDVDMRTGNGLWSELHFEHLGYKPRPGGAATIEMWRSRLHPDDADRVTQAMHAAMRDGSLYNPEYRIIRADNGQIVWLSTAGRFLYEGGRAVRFIGALQDFTARKRSEEEIARLNQDLQRRVRELQTLLDVLPVGIGIARDPACERIDVNRYFANVLEVPLDSNASLTAPPDQRPAHFTLWNNGKQLAPDELPLQKAAREGAATRNLEMQVRMDDGRVIDLLEFAVPLLDESGRPWGAVAVFVDISELRRVQDLVQKQHEDLAHLSRLITMGEMASGLAHELNQPLGAVLNYAVASMAVLESPPEAGGGAKGKVLDLLREVERETKRAGEIISRLRSFVRKKAPHRVPVEVAGLIENAAKLMGADLRLQTVRLSVDVPDGLRVKADPVQIEQVLVNLIRNAVEAMASVPVPARRLVIGASPDGAASVEVSVADTGAGFAAGQEERIFDSFFTTKPDGIGVGLTISRSIVEAHGGRLTTAANPGGGVMFRFTLPSFMPDSEGVSYEP